MNLREIQSLARLMNTAGLTCMEITEGETRIRMEKAQSATAMAVPVPLSVSESTAKFNVDFTEKQQEDFVAVRSPMVGVFYGSPSPEAPSFVTIGSTVQKGDVLCIIESMKLMNEIVAEGDGIVAEICAKTGDVAEYGQTLFKLRQGAV